MLFAASIVLPLVSASAAGPEPLACQPNDEQPMLPIFHIIGNVTKNADNSIKLEAINDCSGVTFYEGLWHVWHQVRREIEDDRCGYILVSLSLSLPHSLLPSLPPQCCQSHWDHIISKDLVHWQRLPPPIQPVTTRTWDGSISMLPAEDGGPLILYDAEDGKLNTLAPNERELGPLGNVLAPLDRPILGVARLADPNDKYLMTWTRIDNNPVVFDGAAAAFPGQVWKNGDHYNMIMQGNRYQSNDTTFHNWKNMGSFVGRGEHGGQWWLPMPKQVDGSPPPAGTPNYIVNVGGGDLYLWVSPLLCARARI